MISKNKQDDITKILYDLNIGSPEFFGFLKGKVVKLPLSGEEFPWATFPILDKQNVLVDMRILVPKISDEKTLLINIHEFAHAWELYGLLGQVYEENKEKSENYASGKEQAYLKLVRK